MTRKRALTWRRSWRRTRRSLLAEPAIVKGFQQRGISWVSWTHPKLTTITGKIYWTILEEKRSPSPPIYNVDFAWASTGMTKNAKNNIVNRGGDLGSGPNILSVIVAPWKPDQQIPYDSSSMHCSSHKKKDTSARMVNYNQIWWCRWQIPTSWARHAKIDLVDEFFLQPKYLFDPHVTPNPSHFNLMRNNL